MGLPLPQNRGLINSRAFEASELPDLFSFKITPHYTKAGSGRGANQKTYLCAFFFSQRELSPHFDFSKTIACHFYFNLIFPDFFSLIRMTAIPPLQMGGGVAACFFEDFIINSQSFINQGRVFFDFSWISGLVHSILNWWSGSNHREYTAKNGGKGQEMVCVFDVIFRLG